MIEQENSCVNVVENINRERAIKDFINRNYDDGSHTQYKKHNCSSNSTSSWSDLKDKPFYEEPAVMGKVFECTIPAGQNGLYFDAPEGFSFVEGIPVTINGITLKADYAYANEGVHFNCGEYLTIEGHHYWENIIYGQMRVTAYDPNGQGDTVDRHVSIDVDVMVKEPVVHTIEPKFIPGAVLPILDIGDFTGNVTDEATIRFLEAVGNNAMPFLLKYHCVQGGGEIRYRMAIMYGQIAYGEVSYQSVNSQDMATIYKNDGVWSINVSSGA